MAEIWLQNALEGKAVEILLGVGRDEGTTPNRPGPLRSDDEKRRGFVRGSWGVTPAC